MNNEEAYINQMQGEWRSRSTELANWVMQHLVNRTDVWGRYLPRRSRKSEKTKGGFCGHAITAPFRDERGKSFLETSSLEKHFKATDGGMLGIHSIGVGGTSRWLAIDIDRHDVDDVSVTPESNFVAARNWYLKIQSLGFDPLLFDSNGQGGFHLWVIFAEPMDARSVHELGQQWTDDFAKQGLDQKPELFPSSHNRSSQDRKSHGQIRHGNWLRLPGRHHTLRHYTRVFNDQAWDDRPWLEGHDAIDRILTTRPADPSVLIPLGLQQKTRTVCVDFDGVLHSYRSGWKGESVIPDPPIHGARSAIKHLRESYRVVVHSARCHSEIGRLAIANWLARHDIEVDEICEHKPPAMVYIDDRGISFTGDWEQTIAKVNDFRR